MGVFCQYRQALVSLFASSDAISIRSVLPELCGVTSLVKTRASIIITHKGRQAVAICLNDIKKQNMRQNNNYASLNVPKDFIRVDCNEDKINRRRNGGVAVCGWISWTQKFKELVRSIIIVIIRSMRTGISYEGSNLPQ